MLLTVIDTETTGLEGEVVEVAAVLLSDESGEWGTDGLMTTLVRPSVPIEVEAMAVHHITDEMVEDALTLEEVTEEYWELRGVDVAVAHNAKFDSAMMPEGWAGRWICTYRCACHIWPDAPSHGNQALRYWLKLDVSDMPHEAGMTPHRALYDAWVTAKLMLRILEQGLSVDELVRMSSQPVLLTKMRFGKHKGEPVSDVPYGYLEWMVRQGDKMCPDHVHTARCEMERRRRGG